MSASIASLRSPLTATQRSLIERGIAQVESVARRLMRQASGLIDFSDLVGLGHDGLVEAAVAFEPGLGVPFEGFAMFRVRGAMLDGIRRRASEKRCLLLAARKASCDYASSVAPSGDVLSDTDAESAAKLRAFSDGVVASMFAALAAAPKSPATDELFSAHEARDHAKRALAKAKASLPKRDRRLLEIYYEEQRNLKDAAEELSISHVTARKAHVALLDQLAKKLKAQGVLRAPPALGEAE